MELSQDPNLIRKRELARARYAANPEPARLKARLYQGRKPFEQKERDRKWQREYIKRPHVKARRLKYRAERRAKSPGIEKRKLRARNPLGFVFANLRYNARKRGIPFDLRVEEFVLPKVCPVLGIPINFGPRHHPNLPTFDRIDPTKGYVRGNVRIISWRANLLKHDSRDPAELRAVANYMEANLAGLEPTPAAQEGVTAEMVEAAAKELLVSLHATFPRDWNDLRDAAERVLRKGIEAAQK